MQKNIFISALVIVALVLVGWGFYASQTPAPSTEDNFIHDGVVIKDNPGFKPGVWFLSYEEEGSPGLSVELDLNSVPAPYISLTEGQRVHVEGTVRGSVVTVHSITVVSTETGTHIKLYFYNPALDQGPGGVQCSEKGLVAVERVLPKTTTPLKDSIELLLRGELSDEERAQGVTTEFPLVGVSLKSAILEQGIATLTFNDPQNKTGGGSCRVGILWAQVEATAKQFSTVKSVHFMPEDLFQP
ncbi:MAG: GerMN domain-containing protein [Patescibacteria group bacterium]